MARFYAACTLGLEEVLVDELHGVEAFEDFPDYLETIEAEAYRLKKVVRRLLDTVRVPV